jgi:hypothetical protein
MGVQKELVIEPAQSWARLQQVKNSEWFIHDLEEQLKEHHRLFLEELMRYDRQQLLGVAPDKFRGYPTIRDLKELREVTSRGRRTWLISVPYSPQSNGPEVGLYLNEYAKVVFESYRAKVLLIGGESQPVESGSGLQCRISSIYRLPAG